MFKSCIPLYILFSFTIGQIYAQDYQSQDPSSRTSVYEDTDIPLSKYYGIGYGRNHSYFTDFATSPLSYAGVANQFSLARIKESYLREIEYGITYDLGTYRSDVNNHRTASNVKRVELVYSHLFRIGLLQSKGINTKVGILLASNANLRINESLLNNGVGIEMFGTLFGSIKLTKDISRKTEKNRRFLFWKYKLRPRKRTLSFRLNVGLVNSSFRNGYAYSGQSGILNSDKIFDEYELKLSGFRIGSSLNYTRYLQNKNAVRFSYVWDAYKTGGKINIFQMAHHTLKITLLFNTNNK